MKSEPVMRSTDTLSSASTPYAGRGRKQQKNKNRFERLLERICEALDQVAQASSHPHSKLFNFHRARLIMKRVRVASTFLALLAVAWALIDLYVFPAKLAIPLSGSLMFAGVLFAVLMLTCQWTPSAVRARLAVSLVLAIIVAVFIVSDLVLLHARLSPGDHAAASAYGLLPLVCLAGLAIIPLSLVELLLFAVPILLIFTISFLASADNFDCGSGPIALISALFSITTVAGISSLSQLNLMKGMLRQSLRDPVTRALNRRSGELVLDLQLTQAKRSGYPISVVFLDLNNFKQVNDRLGHAAGDEVLRCVANFLRTGLRASDALVRWGGDEFLLIMPHANEADVTRRLTALMDRQCSPIFHGWQVAWSAGIAQWPNNTAKDTGKALLEIADNRMYGAKFQIDDRTKAA